MGFGEWRKSSYSSGNDNCVEWAPTGSAVVGVRDSKDPGGPVLLLSRQQWRLFIDGLKAGLYERGDQ